jgi:hypothetical protein
MDTDDTQEVQPVQTDADEVEETQTESTDWKAEALKYKAMAYKYRIRAQEGVKTPPAPKPLAEAKNPDIDEKIWEVAEMIQQGYTKADAEFIQKNGGREALKDPNSYVSVALKTLQEQRRAEAASSETNTSSGMTDIERKYTPEQLKNMTAEELAKILPHASAY